MTIEGLDFSYTAVKGAKALEGITLTIPRGRTTAVVGESSSGKSTLGRFARTRFAHHGRCTRAIGKRPLKPWPYGRNFFIGGATTRSAVVRRTAKANVCNHQIATRNEGFLNLDTIHGHDALGHLETPPSSDHACATIATPISPRGSGQKPRQVVTSTQWSAHPKHNPVLAPSLWPHHNHNPFAIVLGPNTCKYMRNSFFLNASS